MGLQVGADKAILLSARVQKEWLLGKSSGAISLFS